MSIGANIRARREHLKLSQEYVAKKVGISQSMLCQIERGTKVPALPLSAEIAAVLECDLETFLHEPPRQS